MGTKRSFDDVEPPGSDNGTRDMQQRKHRKHKAKEGSSQFTSKRARSIARLLQRKEEDLPADVRKNLERELAMLQAELADKAFHRKRSAMISKYHMVRFFERRKASRLVKQLKRQMEQKPEPDEMERLKQDLHVARVDEAYTLYHPHAEPYISLYGKSRSTEADEDEDGVAAAKLSLRAARPPMWSVVERAVKEGSSACIRLRERRRTANQEDEAKSRRPPSKAGKEASRDGQQQQQQQQQQQNKKEGAQPNRKERRRLMREAREEEEREGGEGGNFFEEFSSSNSSPTKRKEASTPAANEDDDGESMIRRASDLALKMGFGTLSFVIEPDGDLENFFRGRPVFSQSADCVPSGVAVVSGVLGKKQAKVQVAANVFLWLEAKAREKKTTSFANLFSISR
ncbi:hypothetical protein CP533_0803 [Ophiocordyceps camponoti-saundersi (nom. inval.)]|nr:hypothetical protein CP533_0803 [Ophiocordyceps camponoti-saundersi (nom. inval.)]